MYFGLHYIELILCILNYRSTDLIDCMDLQPAVQQLLHEPSLQEGNLREMGELDAERWESV